MSPLERLQSSSQDCTRPKVHFPPLQLDRDYHWTLKAKVPCGTSAANRVYVDGWVKRVSLPSASAKSDTFAQKGIWYDAVTSLAQ